MTRDAAVTITLTTLRFFRDSVQGTAPDATGYKGLLLSLSRHEDGQRAWRCELSTVDTRIPAGRRTDRADYFERDNAGRRPDQNPGRRAVSACRLAMGAARRGDAHAWL